MLRDAQASLDLTVVVGVRFVRGMFTGVYASDFGIWDTNLGTTVRHQHTIGAEDVRLFQYLHLPRGREVPGQPLTHQYCRNHRFNTLLDGIGVSGITAGAETDSSLLAEVKKAIPNTPVFANTGVRVDNVKAQLSIADGAIVGTHFKKHGVTWNAVGVRRVKEFMAAVRALRG